MLLTGKKGNACRDLVGRTERRELFVTGSFDRNVIT